MFLHFSSKKGGSMQVLNTNLVGKVLGTYRLEALIGKGGMSAVFLAQQLQLARRVAVKVLLPDVMMDNSLYEEFLIRFQREASLIAGLEHLNITPIYDYGKHEGIAYLVMPYLAGGNTARCPHAARNPSTARNSSLH